MRKGKQPSNIVHCPPGAHFEQRSLLGRVEKSASECEIVVVVHSVPVAGLPRVV